MAAALLPDAKGLLLAGTERHEGSVCKVDLEGNPQWKKTYVHKWAVRGEKDVGAFRSIALADDQGGFVVAGDFGKISKFGWGEKSAWLLRCDAAGNVLSEVTFPGRDPSVCAIGRERFAILYDAGSGMSMDSSVCLLDRELRKRWETKVDIIATCFDLPTISSIPSHCGFLAAGRRPIHDKTPATQGGAALFPCVILQLDASGHIVSSTSIPVATRTTSNAHLACTNTRAYVALGTQGSTMLYCSAPEAGIFDVPINTKTK